MSYKERKDADASPRGMLIRELIARFTSDHLIGKKIKNGELRKKLIETPWTVPAGLHMEEIEMEQFQMEWLEADSQSSDMVL